MVTAMGETVKRSIARAQTLAGRVVLVGEDNPRSRDPRAALWPLPPNCAGGRLARILGHTRVEYLRLYARTNLCASGAWSMDEAERAARALLAERPAALVLLGARVARAFLRVGVESEMFAIRRVDDVLVVALPHPSGRNLAYNDPSRCEAARAIVRELRQRVTVEMVRDALRSAE